MTRIRIVRTTLGVAAVTLSALLLPSGLRAEEGAAAPDPAATAAALRRLVRPDLPAEDRLAAAGVVLQAGRIPDVEAALDGATLLLQDDAEVAGWLALHALEAGWVPPAAREAFSTRVTALAEEGTAADRAARAAAGLLVGRRPEGVARTLVGAWPPSPLVAAVLEREVVPPAAAAGGPAPDDEPATWRALVAAQRPDALLLDEAAVDDPVRAEAAVYALLDRGAEALPYLRHQALAREGRFERAVRAMLVLGLQRDRDATPLLMENLVHPDGWVRVGAATALGDIGDPRAAVALCRQIAYRGDLLRARDQWDYPGERETTVAREDWASVDYFVVDVAAADALLRMGFQNPAGYLIHEKLDPSKAHFRIRLLQDAVDALRRALPAAPVDAYQVDQGIPQREAAFEALAAWWLDHRDDMWLDVRPDEDDTGFRTEARALVERLRGKTGAVMELMIAQETCALLGRSITPVLLETLAEVTNRTHRTEITRALGFVRDERAIPALLGLLAENASFIRAAAAESLGTYVDADPRVVQRLIEMLDDPEPGPRVAAMKSLSAAAASDAVRTALASHPPSEHDALFGGHDREYGIANTIARLVQEQDAALWTDIEEGLVHEERYVRRAWWDLLRAAAHLPEHVYDAVAEPHSQGWAPFDEERARSALAAWATRPGRGG